MIIDRSVRPGTVARCLLTAIPVLVLGCSSEPPDESSAETESAVTADIERARRNADGSYEVTCRDGRIEHDVSVAAITSCTRAAV